MKYIKQFKAFSLNEEVAPETGTQQTGNATSGTNGTSEPYVGSSTISPVVVYAYTAANFEEAKANVLLNGGEREANQITRLGQEVKFNLHRECPEDQNFNYDIEIASGLATAGNGPKRWNHKDYHADPKKSYTYTISAIAPEVNGLPLYGAYVVNIGANSGGKKQGDYMNPGNVTSEFGSGTTLGKKFYPVSADGKITFPAHSAIVHIVYAKKKQGSTEGTQGEASLSVTYRELFDYNAITVKTESEEFKDLTKKVIEFINAHQGTKFTMRIRGNASFVNTSYEGGNKKLARDRAISLGKAIRQVVVDTGIKWADLMDSTHVVSAVTGPKYYSPKKYAKEYTDQNVSKEKYYEHQYATVEMSSNLHKYKTTTEKDADGNVVSTKTTHTTSTPDPEQGQ